MRREVLEKAAIKIRDDLQSSGMADMLKRGIEAFQRPSTKDDSRTAWLDLGIIAEYVGRAKTYSETEIYISSVLDIERLTETAIWQKMFLEPNPSFLFSVNTSAKNAINFLPQIISLLQREYGSSDSPELKSSDLAVQTVVLSSEGRSLSSPRRIIELLSSVEIMYAAIAEANNVSVDTLAVVAMDSGSEKSFDFLGVAKVMEQFKETLQWLFNVVAYHKQNATIRNLQVASETLSVIAELGKLENDGALTGEQASRVRHSLFSGLEKFAGTGAYIPEMEMGQQAPAQLMRPQPRLLTGPAEEMGREDPRSDAKTATRDQVTGNISASDEYSEAEIASAVEALRQSRSSTSAKEPRIRKPRARLKPS